MKSISLESEGLTVEQLIQVAERGEVVFLTSQGQTRFALIPADEGDQEICALRSNPSFMAYLDGCEQRARDRPRKSLAEMQKQYGDDESGP